MRWRLFLLALLLLASTAPVLAQGRWTLRTDRLIARLDTEASGESDLEKLLSTMQELAPESRDAAWASFKAAVTLARRRTARGLEDDRTIDLLSLARRCARWSGSKQNEAYAASELARLHVRRGRSDLAETVLRQSLEEAPVDAPHLPSLRIRLAPLVAHAGRPDEALELLDRAEAELEARTGEGTASRDELLRIQIVARRGKIRIDRGLPDRGAVELTLARTRLEALPPEARSPALHAEIAIYFANLRLATESYSLLEQEIRRTLERFDGFPSLPSVRRSLELRLAVAHRHAERLDPDRPPRAHALLEGVLDDPRSLGNDRTTAALRLADLALARSDFDEARQRLASIEGASLGLGERTERATLLTRLELAAGSTPDVLSTRRRELEEVIDARFELWESTRPRRGGWGFLRYGPIRSALGTLIRVTLVLEADDDPDRRALELLLRVQGLGSLARELEAPEASLERIRADLMTLDEGVLVFLPAVERSHGFLLDARRVECFPLPSRDLLDRARKDLVVPLLTAPGADGATRRDEKLRTSGRVLAERLLPPAVEDWIRERRALTIVGTDLLGYVPFECLIDRDGERLGKDHAIGYLPSLPLGLALEARRRERPVENGTAPSFVLFAGTLPPDGEEFPPLRLSPEHESSFRRAYAPGEARLFLGSDAEARSLENPVIASARVLQLLVHGLNDPDRERPAGLQLSCNANHDGRIFSERLETLGLPPLIVLTACGTGRGPGRLGDPSTSDLGGALFRGGAETVLLPTGNLAFEPTLTLSHTLHAALRRGASPADALRLARAELSGTSHDDPFFHSVLHARGLAHRSLFAPAPSGIEQDVVVIDERSEGGGHGWWWTLVPLAVLGGGLLLFRRRAGHS